MEITESKEKEKRMNGMTRRNFVSAMAGASAAMSLGLRAGQRKEISAMLLHLGHNL
jgi:hypothetical protein